jgi:hypothetical protein
MEQHDIKFIENHLHEMWLKLNLDRPSNWENLLEYVIEDVKSSSSYLLDGDYHGGDVEIAFRRFFEMASYDVSDNYKKMKKRKIKINAKILIENY